MNAESIELLREENQDLRRRAEEAEDVLRALHTGEADAILVESEREEVYILGTADEPYRLMIEQMPYSAATLTAEGTIIQCNSSFIEMLRLPLGSLLGKPIVDFIAAESGPALNTMLREAQSADVTGEIIFERGDGAVAPIYLCAKMKNEGARGRCIVITDLTEQRLYQRLQQTQEALRASEEQLRIADKRKDEFIATLAHELRNPLSTIANAASLIAKSGISDPTVKWGTEVIDRQLKHTTRLLDDLLDIARITTGKLALDMQRIELADVLEAAIESSKPLIERFSHTFEANLPSEPALLDADGERLAEVFMNLLTNSAKYTDPGGRIDLEAKVQGDEVTVAVKDTGRGIAADKLPYVFDMFFQSDGGVGRTGGGLGIGLFLARQLVELHGGSLEAFSPGLGSGSEFIVRLPLLQAKP